jgi:predicted RNA-binding Zn-ribbon protein involved in translation (DUF1610 family)
VPTGKSASASGSSSSHASALASNAVSPSKSASAAGSSAPDRVSDRVVQKKCPECGAVVLVRLSVTRTRCSSWYTKKCKVFYSTNKWMSAQDA